MKVRYYLLLASWAGLWFTPDQQGQRLMNRHEFAQAAESFDDPMRQGAAWYRAGEFEKAMQAFARVSSPEAYYDLGNAWVMLGKYDKAIASYDQAIKQRPNWKEAEENRALASARAKMLQQKGGDLGDQREGADQVVFDKNNKSHGENTEVASEQAVTDGSVQSLWLRNVQTRPADFLKSKFAYQHTQDESGEKP